MPRTQQSAAWAARRRAQLLRAMGDRCRVCSADTRLEFHHPHGRTWEPRRVNRWVRIARYWRDYRDGNLELLCRSCNAVDGGTRGGNGR